MDLDFGPYLRLAEQSQQLERIYLPKRKTTNKPGATGLVHRRFR